MAFRGEIPSAFPSSGRGLLVSQTMLAVVALPAAVAAVTPVTAFGTCGGYSCAIVGQRPDHQLRRRRSQ
jgi:hypothetical protein